MSLVRPCISFLQARCLTFLALEGGGLDGSSGSSSDGVGNTLKGFVELFLLDGFAGVLAGVAAAAVDFRFLGDDRLASSYKLVLKSMMIPLGDRFAVVLRHVRPFQP